MRLPVRRPSRQPGFTLLELVLVILIISILGIAAIDRLLEYRVDAERAMVRTVVGNLRSALGMEVAKRVARDRIRTINNLENSNPFALLAQPPENYIGEIEDESRVVENGVWYFDTGTSALVYRIRFADYFRSPLPGPARVRYRIELVLANNNRDNRTTQVTGLNLVPLENYQWEFPK
ncbi:prepilin-type N-terminal cleavage/methylation domain-containing protein [Thiohalophilus sp.]|uniref:prepilin-type N-terminal cleavage/methylation domain-containing protein n=1 Tax=Thiohalophilus sp. TaxID=3028392 RepID=UPI002ACEA893|nr:prepilin-type N-terminal cleavage/methylation domain-containing protein [Thiohalophilus sp.]MDZ7803405.1 prepilin-type N-terminal cleavage/methylation domain-containing protein [Thiohalophilus sp.]